VLDPELFVDPLPVDPELPEVRLDGGEVAVEVDPVVVALFVAELEPAPPDAGVDPSPTVSTPAPATAPNPATAVAARTRRRARSRIAGVERRPSLREVGSPYGVGSRFVMRTESAATLTPS
jgi:hypothetical protein